MTFPAARGWLIAMSGLLLLLIGPFLLVGPRLEGWATQAVAQLAGQPILVGGVIAALLAADVLLPLPSSILAVTAGVLLGPWAGTIWAWAGMSVGCALGYWLGRRYGRRAIDRLVGDRELARVERLSGRYGDLALIATRALPVLAEASTILAGVAAVRPGRFLALTSLSNLAIAAVYASVGAWAADTQSFLLAVTGAFLLPLVALWLFGPALNSRRTAPVPPPVGGRAVPRSGEARP